MSFDQRHNRRGEVIDTPKQTPPPRRTLSSFPAFAGTTDEVLPPRQKDMTLQLLAFPDGAMLARRVTAAVLECWQWPGDHDTALLVMDELFSNACAATPEGPVWAGATWEPDGVELQVWDQSPLLPTAPALPADDAVDGRGNYIVKALTIRSGTTPTALFNGGGKVVWGMVPTFAHERVEAL
jgi:hypothetical protein